MNFLRFIFQNNYYNGHLFLFLPSVEANNGQEIFLSTTPWDLVKSGSTANVPILVGICKDDALPIAHRKHAFKLYSSQNIFSLITVMNVENHYFSYF